MPTALVGTPDGLVASDVWLADLTGDDGLPDVAIGRLPVVTSDQLRDYLAKVQAFEASASAPWQRHVLMAADDPDAEGNFPADSDRIASALPTDQTVEKVYLPTTSPAAARQAILGALDAGSVLFHYVGHGAPDHLAQEGIFSMTDVASLANADRLTLFVALTCSVGDFAAPATPSLGEAMLLLPDRRRPLRLGPLGPLARRVRGGDGRGLRRRPLRRPPAEDRRRRAHRARGRGRARRPADAAHVQPPRRAGHSPAPVAARRGAGGAGGGLSRAVLVAEQLAKGDAVRLRAAGHSMTPFVRAGDVVTLEPLRGGRASATSSRWQPRTDDSSCTASSDGRERRP